MKIVYGNTVKMKHVKRFRKNLYALKESENLVFVHGIGKRKSPLQKSIEVIEVLEEYLAKIKEYNQKIHICGERNSYSKTDHNATFMRMKEDVYICRNGKKLKVEYIKYSKSKTGYVSEIQYINVVIVADVPTRMIASREIIAKHLWKNEIRCFRW